MYTSGNLAIIISDFGVSPGKWQDIAYTNAGFVWNGSFVSNFCDTSIKIEQFSFKERILKMAICNMVAIWSSLQCTEVLICVDNWLIQYGLVMSYGNIHLDQLLLKLWLVAWLHQTNTWSNHHQPGLIHLRSLLQKICKYQSVRQDWKLHF